MAQSRKLSRRVSRKSTSHKRASILKRISKSLKKMMSKVKQSISCKSKRVTRKRASPKRRASHKVGSRSQVFHGYAHKTAGGLMKSDLMMNKHGRIVSRKAHKAGKKALKHLHAVAKPW